MAKNIFRALLASDDDGDDDRGDAAREGASPESPTGPVEEGGAAKARSLPDAFERLARQNRRIEARLESLEAVQKQVLEATQGLHDTAKAQLKVLDLLGKFHEASERRGREMEAQFRGIPDVLRTLPSATREQAERLSEIAARLYEKAQDNTVNALKSAQANHQRAVEDLIEKSLGASRQALWAAIVMTAVSVVAAVWMFLHAK